MFFDDTINEHASRLDHVLERFDRANLQLQPCKCIFAQPQVEYLGYVVSRDGIWASPEKTRAAKNFQVSRNAKEVRSFLGLASFHWQLVPNFAQISEAANGTAEKGSTVRVDRTSAVRV